MNKLSRLFLSSVLMPGLMTVSLMATSAWAQVEPVPFECTGDAYTVRDNPAKLFRIDQGAPVFVFEQIGGDLSGQVNNLGYDTIENLLYAIAMPGSGNSNFGVIKIDSTGAVFPVPTSGLPTNKRFLAGDVSTDGSTFYVNTYPTTTLYVIDLDTMVATPQATSASIHVADWAYNPDDGMLYGAKGLGTTADTGATVYQLNPDTGVISAVGQPPGLPLSSGGDAQYYGGAWFNQFGRLFLYRNSDFIYEIDLTGPVIVSEQAGGAGSSQLNDAAACAAEDPTIDKFYTHTNNDWSLRCAEYVIDEGTGLPTSECVEYRLPNINDDDDIFAEPLYQDTNDAFVLWGQENRKKTVVTPGQYIAVSNINTLSLQDIWVLEDFSDCSEIGSVNPFSVPGGVQVVRIDADGKVHDIDDDLALGIGGFIELTADDALVHVEDVPAGNTIRVMVKFQPSSELGIIGNTCTNHEILFFDDPKNENEIRRASADLIIAPAE